jgi:hypothetical protein
VVVARGREDILSRNAGILRGTLGDAQKQRPYFLTVFVVQLQQPLCCIVSSCQLIARGAFTA